MPTQSKATEPDLVELVEELLAKATLPVKKHLRFGVGGILREPDGLLKPVVEVFNDEDFELYAAAPDLLRRLVEEVKGGRELLRECLSYVLSSAEASRMMNGFEPQEHKEDQLAARLVDAIGDKALRKLLFKKPKGPF